MARSKKQTTRPYPRRLTRAQRAADRRWQADEPPSDDGTEDPPLVEATVECQSEVFETTDVDVDQPETTSPMVGRHLSRSQIITACRHAIVATATDPKTTSEASIPVTRGANLPISTTLPPPTVTAGNFTTTPNPILPLNTTLTHSYTNRCSTSGTFRHNSSRIWNFLSRFASKPYVFHGDSNTNCWYHLSECDTRFASNLCSHSAFV